MTDVSVHCEEASPDGWRCEVEIGESGSVVSHHTVRVCRADLARLAPGEIAPDELVERSFRFLLQRESPSMILRTFDLTDIGRYFPDFARELHRPSG